MATPSEPATRPAVTINRDAAVSFPDRALVYKILLDDAVAGEIHAGERHPLDVTCGRHTLQVRAGRSFRSPVVEFEVGDEPVTFACGPSPRLNAVTLEGDLLLDLIASAVGLPPDDHLWLRPADRASVEPGAGL